MFHKDKQADATGGSSGICNATAIRLRDKGMRVAAVGINQQSSRDIFGVEHLTVNLSKIEDRYKVGATGKGAHTLVSTTELICLKPIRDFTLQDIRDIYVVNVEYVEDLTIRIGRTMSRGASAFNFLISDENPCLTV